MKVMMNKKIKLNRRKNIIKVKF